MGKHLNNTIYCIILISLTLCVSINAVNAIEKNGAMKPDMQQNDRLQITGRVTDLSGEPIIGATIKIKGAVLGTATDTKGLFTLDNVPAGATLTVSYIGYKSQEIKVGAKTSFEITLIENTEELEEVVVVGYGTQKKINLTGAVAQIAGERFANRSVPTLTQALQGTVANLNITTPNGAPGTKQNINIRGYTGINIDDYGNKSNVSGSPLIVIDGVQGGDISSVNMNDVESISVLKDAASAAIYGSSAPFGVIIINTKKGSAGKPVISYNNNFGFSSPTNLPHYVNSLDFARAFNEVGENSNYTAKLFDDEVMARIKAYLAGTLKDETIKNPSSDNWLSWNAANANNDWFRIYFKKAGFSQQHNVGVSGGTNTSGYYIGLGYNRQDGLYHYAKDSYQRYNIRTNVSSKLTNWMTVSLRGAFSREETVTPTVYGNISGGSGYSYDYFHQLGRTYPTVPVKNPDGYYSEGSGISIFTDGGRQKLNDDNAILTGEFNFTPLPGWDITANYTYDGYYSENINHRKTFYTVKPSGVKEPRGGTSPNYISRSMYKNQHHVVNAFTSYELNAGKHNFKILGGFTQELYDNLMLSGSNDNLYSDEIPMLSMTFGANRSASDNASQLAIRGSFGRINYNFADKYLIELNGRYDGTSRFLKDVRYKFYPGISAAWVLSHESFWEPLLQYVNHLKLRASYASLGDQSFTSSYYPFYPSLKANSPTGTNWIFSGGRESSISQPGLVNYDLTWITTNTQGYGVDMALFGNRLNVSFDWYRRHAKDFVSFGEKLPAILGTSAPRINDAETETKGFEITAGWRDIIGKVSYGASLVLSDYKGKILKYNNPAGLISDMWYDGMTMGEIWGYETVGLFKSQAEIDGTNQSYINSNWYVGDVHYKDLNGDGKIDRGKNTVDDPGDRKIIGNNSYRFPFSVDLNGDWKGFDLRLFVQGVGKRTAYPPGGHNGIFFWGQYATPWVGFAESVLDNWDYKGDDGYFPRMKAEIAMSGELAKAQTKYLQNAAYARLKNITIGYTLPRQWTNRWRLEKLRLYASGENLYTLHFIDIPGSDPERFDNAYYPFTRVFTFGLNLTF